VKAEIPASLSEALAALAADPELVPTAGCTDLMVSAGTRALGIPGVVDLSAIPELRGVRRVGEEIEIGAATSFTEIGSSMDVKSGLPALAAAADVIGGWQIQNRATLGGNMANASPAGDSLPVLLALGATVVVASLGGEREIPYERFHLGYRRTALEPGELIARVRIPVPPRGSRQLFRKVGTRAAQAISKVVAAIWARLDDGVISEARLAAGSVAPIPVRLTAVEELLAGRRADAETASEAGALAAASVEPIDDVRSTAAYRRFALGRVVRRFILQLAG
jgi:CO/xanthine dehydrogenase FAD-binding subunit